MTDNINILDEVKKILEERKKEYGPFYGSLENIAHIWNTYLKMNGKLNEELAPTNIAIMFILFKIVRESNEHKDDNIKDMIGYAVGLGECYECYE